MKKITGIKDLSIVFAAACVGLGWGIALADGSGSMLLAGVAAAGLGMGICARDLLPEESEAEVAENKEAQV